MLDVELLISEVQLNPCLWDLSDKEYSNREVKKKTWNQIAKNIFSDWETIQIGERKEKRKYLNHFNFKYHMKYTIYKHGIST